MNLQEKINLISRQTEEILTAEDLKKIKETAVGYFKEGLSIAYQCLGGNPKDLNFILGSDFYHNNDLYWQTLIEIAKNTSLSRMQRSITILGRKEDRKST